MKTEEERSATSSFVGLCPVCKLLLACAVDEPEHAKETATFVASMIRSGLIIEKRSVADVRKSDWCKCPREKKKKARCAATPVPHEAKDVE